MIIYKNFNIKHINSFKVNYKCHYYVIIENRNDLLELYKKNVFSKSKFIFIGGGTNILFKNDYEGIIFTINIKGISYKYDNNDIILNINGGEIWNDIVELSIKNKYYGIENLIMIPGRVSAAPVQNIGAYGTSLEDVLINVEVFDLNYGIFTYIDSNKCCFGYRESIFKQKKYINRYIIISINIKLSKVPKININYPAIIEYLNKYKIYNPTINDIGDIISYIRSYKLPDINYFGNAGSFFKNPIVTYHKYLLLKKINNSIKGIKLLNNYYKIPAYQLIELCGWKNKKINNIGLWHNHSLVIVNYNNGNGQDIYNFAKKIYKSVYNKFNIKLCQEVHII
ncbi:MAG: UDP-N-acetylmuramate dehydrogenase [Bacteroides sp.]|nr:MAG: UDP-N-acetylmuramate dehydrogenase [Bacteroides sp.]